MPTGRTTYPAGTSQTDVFGGQSYAAGPINAPNESLLDANSMKKILDTRSRQVAAERAPAGRAGANQQRAMQRNAVIRRPMPQRRAPVDNGVPMFIKPMGGAGYVGGYARASQGDPGAVFAGYGDPRAMPSSASFSAAGMVDDAHRQQAAALDFERFQRESALRQEIDRYGGIGNIPRPAPPPQEEKKGKG